ncbi:MAG: SCP2 sterol-binding domain-containing protein [Saprospiraceae bacterium]
MNIEIITEAIKSQAENVSPLGAKLKFVLDGEIILIDGTGDSNIVTNDDSEADTTITTTKETLIKLKSGELNPMMAVMGGKVKIKGDMGLAMKLQSLLS